MKAHVVLCQGALKVLQAHFPPAGIGSLLQYVNVASVDVSLI